MTVEIFPTENDIGGSGAGLLGTEPHLSEIFAAHFRYNYMLTHPTFAYSDQVVSVGPFEALISGYRYKNTESQDITVNLSESDQVWYLKLTRNGSNQVTGASWVRVLSPNPDGSDDPADSVPVFVAYANASKITLLELHCHVKPDVAVGDYTGNGVVTFVQFDARPVLVIVFGSGETNANIFAMSHVYETAKFGFYLDTSGTALSSSGAKVPQIDYRGFWVESGSGDNLNESGKRYVYLAII